MSKPVLAAILCVVAILGIFAAVRLTPKGEVTAAASLASDPDTKFLIEKAKQCQGDFSKLSPADQSAVMAKTGNNRNYAETSMRRYYEANK